MHQIVIRTTLNIDKPVLDELKRLGRKRKKTVGQVASELLAASISEMRKKDAIKSPRKLKWTSRSMGAKIDIDDKEAMYSALDTTK